MEEKHMTEIIEYLSENGNCLKSDIYSNISTSSRMADKLDLLESAGIILQTRSPVGNGVTISITEKGSQIHSEICTINEILSKD